jgi:hypothetical protein
MINYFFRLNQCLTAKMVGLGHKKNISSLRARTSQKTLYAVQNRCYGNQMYLNQSHKQVFHRAGLDYDITLCGYDSVRVCVLVRAGGRACVYFFASLPEGASAPCIDLTGLKLSHLQTNDEISP